MSYFPSHKNSTNARNERRQHYKNQIAQFAAAKKPLLEPEQAAAKFAKQARAFLADNRVSVVGNCYRVAVGTGAKWYPVYKIQNSFRCACSDAERYGDCGHKRAAAFDEQLEREANRREDEKPFTATLRYGNRKGLDFDKSARFSTQREAAEWLADQAVNKFQPEGEVTDTFGDVVFEITDEFFELWAEQMT